MTDGKPTLHLILEMHESHFFRNTGRTWAERVFVKLGLSPPHPEEEIAAVWVVPPDCPADNYEDEGIDITGPISESIAKRVLEALRTAFEQLGFAVVIDTDYP